MTAVRKYQRQAILIAKELCYPSSTIARIKVATSESEISRIMMETRRKWR